MADRNKNKGNGTGNKIHGKKRRGAWARRILSAALSAVLAVGAVPAAGLDALATGKGGYKIQTYADGPALDNGYIRAEISEENGCFDIRTVEGDKINKDDNNKNLLFPNAEDTTSFTSFQVTRNGRTKEYIFGGSYDGSSPVEVRGTANELTAVWSVDDLTFTQKISLVNTGANEHGMVYISYTVENQGQPADVKARVLLDTALGNQDYAYYRVGTNLIEQETALGENGYNKSFYCYDDPFYPRITAYIVNASLDGKECRPYRTVFAHWNNLASTVFDYEADSGMTFTNVNNKKYLTADSACALYYDMGSIARNASQSIAANYGVFSNEQVTQEQRAAVNVTAKEVMELTADGLAYEEDGKFTVRTAVENISDQTYERVRIVMYTTGALNALDEYGNDVGASYDEPYYRDVYQFVPGQRQTIDWNLQALPQEEGMYASICFKVYDISGDATMNTGELMVENYMGEGSSWILCPGTVDKVPQIQFTGSSPELLYPSGRRTFYVTGKNFAMLQDKGSYSLMLSRVDGQKWNGVSAVAIASEKFSLDMEKNTMTVLLDDGNPGELPEGEYQLTIDYTDTGREDISAPALRFAVKKDEKYRNESYGLLVAVKESDLTYHIESFDGEDAYLAALESGEIDRKNALLEFRGIFSARKSGAATVYTGISSGAGDNVMTLNSCLDIEDGSVTITEYEGSVEVDFDAGIYTTGSRTYVYKGVGALTALKEGEDCGLVAYNEDGEREQKQPGKFITLLWPSVGQAAQNLLGFLMNFKYGELGVIRHDGADETRVVGFGAALDLSFVIPDFQQEKSNKSVLGDAYNAAIHAGGLTAAELRSLNDWVPYNIDTAKTDADKEDESKDAISGSIQIDDVLFGGKFLGVNMKVALSVPGYIDGMPSLKGELTLKTVGNWEVGVSGSCDFSMFCMEGEISVKSKNNIPIPDNIKFYMGGFTPGVCLDPCAVLWLQGAGGGIENLYDTVFLTESIPPLKLILQAQLSLMQVISAKATLSLSLRGIGASLEDGKVANLDSLTVLDSAKIQVDWYPEFYFMGSVQLGIMDVIKGSGYVVVEQNGFFEFFVRASISLPDDIFLIGGMEVASTGLGANAEKIWGQVKALKVSLGIVYYWGGKVEWGGGASAEPTYPELAGMSARAFYDDIPVYYDEAAGRTLYAHVGTNLVHTTETGQLVMLAEDTEHPDVSVRAVEKNSLQTDISGAFHLLELAAKEKDELLLIEWEAENAEEARTYVEAGGIKIQKAASGLEGSVTKEIKLLDHTKTVEEQEDANANLTYDPETKKAALVISFTEEQEFDARWQIATEKFSSVLLYDLEPMPEFGGEPGIVVKDGKMTVTLDGTKLDQFDSISFVAVEKQKSVRIAELAETEENAETKRKSSGRRSSNGSEEVSKEAIAVQGDAILLYKVQKEDSPEIFREEQSISVTFDLPVDLLSGGYELRIVADDKNCLYHSEAGGSFAYTNPNQPAGPGTLDVAYGGDYRLKLSVTAPVQAFDGYRVTVYDENGESMQGISGVLFTADGEPAVYQEDGTVAPAAGERAGTVELTVGGQYQFRPDESEEIQRLGLEAGKNYQVGVSTWKQIRSGDRSILLYSEELRSARIVMEGKVETEIAFRADEKAVDVETQSGDVTFTIPAYSKNNLKITVSASGQPISGAWKLDGGTMEGRSGRIEQKTEETISFTELEEGVHTLEFMGRNGHGDTVSAAYVFGVDTLAPRLLISSPVSGSFYDHNDGAVKIEGITDNHVRMTIRDAGTGKVYVDSQPVETDQEGRFEKEVKLDTGLAVHALEITVKDALGNQEQKMAELISDALGNIKELRVYTGEKDITNSSVVSGGKYPLALMALLEDGGRLELNDATLVDWRQDIVEGEAVLVQENGKYYLETQQESRGMVTVRFLVSDLGSVSTSFVYRPDSEEKVNLNSEDIVIEVDGKKISEEGEIETKWEYTGEEIRPEVKVLYKDRELTAGTDYTVQFQNNVDVSGEEKKASIQIIGQGHYEGSRTIYFWIVEPEATASPGPEDTASPEPGSTASPGPGATASPEPGATASPDPGSTASPEPGSTASPGPGSTAGSDPGSTAGPGPGATASPEPGSTAGPGPEATPGPVLDKWVLGEDGNLYWYEGGVKQGTEGRGKEIYDPDSDAWYWLDAVDGGKMAVSKDVYLDSAAGIWAENPDGTGKWVRYDGNGHMVKGWDTTEAGTYYFDLIYGTMAKGFVMINGKLYNFDRITGIGTGEPCAFGEAEGWVILEDGRRYWYEGGVRQGTEGRGKEIYDPVSDAWYWLDAIDDGKMTVNKDLYLESAAGEWAENADGTGKWVRYDQNGRMVKGWDTTESGTWYFDLTYGTMAKGLAVIDGREYRFDTVTGVMIGKQTETGRKN